MYGHRRDRRALCSHGRIEGYCICRLDSGDGFVVGGLIVFFFRPVRQWRLERLQFGERCQVATSVVQGPPRLRSTAMVYRLHGMWIVMIYYCGLNQFIVQRNLAAKTLRDGQLACYSPERCGCWFLLQS